MGNEQSQIPGIVIDQKAVEISDFWAQNNASIDTSKLSILIGDLFINEPFWSPYTPLEKFSKNLMIYRHPCIVKYISSWQKTSKFYLAIEEVTPVSHIIATMSSMEICLGLFSVLKALIFLHEKAMVSHNNVCLASIYVTDDGNWKLGGMEYLCQYKDLSLDFLSKSRKHRYSKGVDSNEDKNLKNSNKRKDFIDLYAFCVLVTDVLKNKNDADISNVSIFKDFCKSILQTPDILQRPKLSSILDHDFFKHKFISIHSYLLELPLKLDDDKSEFFSTLKNELEILNEEVVASQLGGLLLSRMVLLNKGAQSCLLPHILVPKKEETDGLFSEETFKKYITPKLLRIFCVRDAQIRILLLEYFPHFHNCFSKEELQSHILPELLLGIKDTNNDLVAATLRTLADLVPILGAETVIGGKRAKLFNDGRPKTHTSSRKTSKVAKVEVAENQMPSASSIDQLISLNSSCGDLILHAPNELPERPRPDGEEGETSSTEEIEPSLSEDMDNWEGWDDNEEITRLDGEVLTIETRGDNEVVSNTTLLQLSTDKTSKKLKVLDITELDIKQQTRAVLEQNELNFFEDMEPVIETSSKFLIGEEKSGKVNGLVSSKLSVNVEDGNEEGWENDDWD